MTDSPRRALITGIGGFVGPHLARHLLEHGYQVAGLIHAGVDQNPPPALNQPDLREIPLTAFNLTDPQSVRNALERTQPEVIFHLAGTSSVQGSFENPGETYQANCRGLENLLEALRATQPDCKFIFAGSADEYGLQIASEEHHRWALGAFQNIFPPPQRIPELPIDELNPLRPLSPYAVSKVYGDFLTRTYWSAYGIRGVVARLFNHEGPGRSGAFVTTSIIQQCLGLRSGQVDQIRIGNVSAFRDWSHVEDIVQGYRILAENGASGEVYVLGSRRMNSVLAYLLLSLSETGYEVEALETFQREKRVEAPLEQDRTPFLGLEFEKRRIDGLLLGGGLSYNLEDRGLLIHTRQGSLRVVFDPRRYRTAEVPLQVSNPARLEALGYRITRPLQQIIRDQVRVESQPGS